MTFAVEGVDVSIPVGDMNQEIGKDLIGSLEKAMSPSVILRTIMPLRSLLAHRDHFNQRELSGLANALQQLGRSGCAKGNVEQLWVDTVKMIVRLLLYSKGRGVLDPFPSFFF